MCYERRRAEACVNQSDHHALVLLFITAVPNTKLCAWGVEDSGGHVLLRIPEMRPEIMWTCTVRAATIRSIVSE